MRDNTTQELLATITAPAITTFYAARLDFKSETVFVWTGPYSIQPTGSGDSMLDGNVFDPLANGVMVEIGDNSFSYSGSDELSISLNIPASPSGPIAAASVIAGEYQTRPAVLWRALRVPATDPLSQPVWLWRRIRSGAMDKVEIQNDGQSHTFNLTIESHQSLVTNASGQTYLDQKRYDATDTSQDFAAAIANGDPAPTKSTIASATPLAGGQYSGARNPYQSEY